jgi:hypothetical protein
MTGRLDAIDRAIRSGGVSERPIYEMVAAAIDDSGEALCST